MWHRLHMLKIIYMSFIIYTDVDDNIMIIFYFYLILFSITRKCHSLITINIELIYYSLYKINGNEQTRLAELIFKKFEKCKHLRLTSLIENNIILALKFKEERHIPQMYIFYNFS